MRILHIVPSYYPAVRYGGPIYSVHALCQGLARGAHQVHVFTTSVDGARDSNVPHDYPVDLDGVRVHYFHSRRLRRLYYSTDLARELRIRVRDFDVVHLHSVFLFPTWAGARAAVRIGVPYVLSPRGMLVRDLIRLRSSATKRAWIHLIERRTLAQATRIHLTSDGEHHALVELGLALSDTVVIPNGVDAPVSFSPDTVSADVRALIADGFDILSFGRINWKKGLDRLILAMTETSDARVLIAGHDEDGFAAKLQKISEQRGISNRVRFLARQITGADKEALFAAARLFVLPSLSENFGNVVVEAMIRGLPVIVTDEVGAAKIVQASGCGVVTRSGQGDFAAAISGLLHSNERLAAMGAAGAKYARERLTWGEIARRFEELYREMLVRSRGEVGRRCAAALAQP
jgi:glycosyltransferase involved in cell wall biosynthesis